MPHSDQMIQLLRVSNRLNHMQSLELVLENVLTEARKFVKADAGSIYLIEPDQRLHFCYTQNDTLQRQLKNNGKLIFHSFSLPVNTESMAGYVAQSGKPLCIENVYQLPDTYPFHFNADFDAKSGYKTQSVLTLPLHLNDERIVGVIQLINALDDDGQIIPFSSEDITIAEHFSLMAAVALERAQTMTTILLRMIKMAELRDPKETGSHVRRVSAYSVELFERWATRRHWPKDKIDQHRDVLAQAAMLHDVGKVGISDLILKKQGKLDDEEYRVMKWHTVMGANLFAGHQSAYDLAALEVAVNHHERWDGHGYPGKVDLKDGNYLEFGEPKKGNEIPIFGRIVAVADVYDALSSRRCYKAAWGQEEVLAEMKRSAGNQFDPELIDILLESVDVLQAIAQRFPDQ